ncbi:MAG: hypothetical protein GX369_00935 [Euryarchaeota archaeon]|nr:hypothetical protein [Euryarchaeota archaeon]
MEENILKEVARERRLTKIIDSPPDKVFNAWIDPLQLRAWWGPHDFTSREVMIEPRVGGKFSVEMEDEDGRIFPMRGVFHEFQEPSRLVFTTSVIYDPDGRPLEALNTIIFNGKEGGTEVVWAWKAIDPAPTAIVSVALMGFDKVTTDSLSRLSELMTRVSI